MQLQCQQPPAGTPVVYRAAHSFKRWCVLQLLRFGGVKVDCLWTKHGYECALQAAGFTQIHVSAACRCRSSSDPAPTLRRLHALSSRLLCVARDAAC